MHHYKVCNDPACYALCFFKTHNAGKQNKQTKQNKTVTKVFHL